MSGLAGVSPFERHSFRCSAALIPQAPNTHLGHRHTNIMIAATKGRDLGVLGVLIHLIGDAINNVGVIIAALVIWLAKYEGRFYADPGVSVGIAILIIATAIPLGLFISYCCRSLLIRYSQKHGCHPPGKRAARNQSGRRAARPEISMWSEHETPNHE